MNYLAHAYLSFHEPGILAGNLISDFVKGKKKFDYSSGIQKGIALHRAIDNFTDDHQATREAKEVFRPAYRLYAGAFVDVVFDHFLATDPTIFTSESLQLFSAEVYHSIDQSLPSLPEKFQSIFPYMKKHDWLFNYQFRWGIERSFAGLVRRAAFMNESNTAFALFNGQYDLLQACYNKFMPQVYQMATAFLAEKQ